MAYMNQEKKQVIKDQLIPVLKKYNVVGTLSVRNNSTICLRIRSGKLDFIGDMNPTGIFPPSAVNIDKEEFKKAYNMNINPYWFTKQYTGRSLEFLTESLSALKAADWYDDTDLASDYFDCAYYIDINVGKWNSPYKLI